MKMAIPEKYRPKSPIMLILALLVLVGMPYPSMGETSQPNPHIKKATTLSQAGNWEQAIPEFQASLALNPDDPRTQANLGVALSRVGRHKEALLAFDKALKLGYDNAEFRYYRGLSFANLNLMDEAVVEIESALEKNSRMVNAHFDLGLLYRHQNRIEEALKQVDVLYRRNNKLAKKLFDQIPSSYKIASIDHGGTIRGKAKLSGKTPKARSFHLIHAPNIEFCSRISDGHGHRIVYDFLVDDNGGMKDTIIAIVGIKKGKPFPQKMKKFHISRCHTPNYVIGIKNGEDILVENTDPIQHEIATYEIRQPIVRQISNKPLPPKSSQVHTAFFKRGTPNFIIKCNLHPFLQSRGFVIDNPYYAATDESGSFEIKDIPPGTYEMVAWHPFLPIQKGTITVTKDGTSEIDFQFKAADAKRKLYHDDTEGYRFNPWYDSFENFYGGPRIDDPVEVLQEFDNSERYKNN